MSQSMGVRYNSPFVGLYLYAPDYVELLKDIKLIYNPIIFISKNESRYSNLPDGNYIVGKLSDKVEIHFLHYTSEEEVIRKWNKRLERLDLNNLIVKFCDRDECTEDLIGEFDKLPFKNKVCFTAKAYPQYKSVCHIKEQSNLQCVENEWECSNKYWNIILKANEAGGYRTCFLKRLLLKMVDGIYNNLRFSLSLRYEDSSNRQVLSDSRRSGEGDV